MRIVFESAAEAQLYNLEELIDDFNIIGAGNRWINRFLDFIESYAKPNVEYALCKNERLAMLQYNCITYNHKWVVAFKIESGEMRIYEIIHGSLLK